MGLWFHLVFCFFFFKEIKKYNLECSFKCILFNSALSSRSKIKITLNKILCHEIVALDNLKKKW